MAQYPELSLQFAPGVPPLEVTDDDWIAFDPAHVLEISIERGKKEALDEVQPGTMTVTLDNKNRGYDPLYYQDTIYEDYFAPGVRIRLQAYDADSGTTYNLFNGFIDGWPQEYRSQPGSVATLQATDAFKYINRAAWAEEQYVRTVMQDAPVAYYRMADVNAVMRDYTDNNLHGTWEREVVSEALQTNNSADSLVITSDKSVELSHEQELDYLKGEIPAEVMPEMSVFSVEFWFKCKLPPYPLDASLRDPFDAYYMPAARLLGAFDEDDQVTSPLSVIVVAGDLDAPIGGISAYATGALRFSVRSPDHTQYINAGTANFYDADGHFIGGGTNYCDDQVHHFVWTVDSTGLLPDHHLYVDGVEFPASGTDDPFWARSSSPWPSGAAQLPIPVNVVYSDDDDPGWQSEWGDEAPFIDEVAFYDHVLTPTRVAQHYADGAALWRGQTTGQRMVTVFTLIDWPEITSDLGQTILGGQYDWETSPIDYINKIINTEQGSLNVAHHLDGEFVFKDRNTLATDVRSRDVQAIFTDEFFTSSALHAVQRSNPSFLASSNPTPVRYSDIVLRWDEKQVVNQVTVEWTYSDQTAELTKKTFDTADGEVVNARTISTILNSEEEAEALASVFINHYGDVFPRLESVTVRPSAMQGAEGTEAWRACLDLREGDHVQVILTPQGIEPAISLDVLIEGIEHRLTNGVEWETQFYCSSGPLQTNYWVLGSDALDATTVVGY